MVSVLFFLLANMTLAAPKDEVKKDQNAVENVSDEEKTETEEEKDYLYDPTGKTDPFKSFIVVRKEALEEEEEEKPKTYLETLELSQLTLSVIVISPKGKWAMVRDSKGDGHVITEGTPIGTKGGVVHEIKEGEVIVREKFKDFRGRTQYNDISKKTPELR
jgi:type IV pilus assembly protein PilP